MLHVSSMSARTFGASAKARFGSVSSHGSSNTDIGPEYRTTFARQGSVICHDWSPAMSPWPSISARSKAKATRPSGRNTHADISA